MKIPDKRKQNIALNYSSNADSKNFIKIYKKCTAEPYSFLVDDTTLSSNNPTALSSNNPLRFRKSLYNI